VKKVVINDSNGNSQDAYIAEKDDDVKSLIANDRRQTMKEHLYMGYLVVGTIAFTLGILISLRRLNGK
jgi:hypothetical protein